MKTRHDVFILFVSQMVLFFASLLNRKILMSGRSASRQLIGW